MTTHAIDYLVHFSNILLLCHTRCGKCCGCAGLPWPRP